MDSPTRLHRWRKAGFPKEGQHARTRRRQRGPGRRARRRPLRCPGPALASAKPAPGIADQPSAPCRRVELSLRAFSRESELDTGLSLGFKRHKWVDMTHCHVKKGLGLVTVWPPLYE